MSWNNAYSLIRETFHKDQMINQAKSSYRKIEEVPPYRCNSIRYNYNEEGYLGKIGEKSTIKIPISMLKRCYEEAINNNNIYNRSCFLKSYPQQAEDHACHIQVIGQIFEKAGVSRMINEHDYRMI